jgi:hypothetical protein
VNTTAHFPNRKDDTMTTELLETPQSDASTGRWTFSTAVVPGAQPVTFKPVGSAVAVTLHLRAPVVGGLPFFDSILTGTVERRRTQAREAAARQVRAAPGLKLYFAGLAELKDLERALALATAHVEEVLARRKVASLSAEPGLATKLLEIDAELAAARAAADEAARKVSVMKPEVAARRTAVIDSIPRYDSQGERNRLGAELKAERALLQEELLNAIGDTLMDLQVNEALYARLVMNQFGTEGLAPSVAGILDSLPVPVEEAATSQDEPVNEPVEAPSEPQARPRKTRSRQAVPDGPEVTNTPLGELQAQEQGQGA